MSRLLMRVPLDFDWPMNKIWPGYLMSLCGMIARYYPKDDTEDLATRFARITGFDDYDDVLGRIEVPKGDGWQMWEDCSEGSPISPVFETKEKLAQWLAANNKESYEQWLAMIEMGWAPSFIATGGRFMSGVEAADKLKEKT